MCFLVNFHPFCFLIGLFTCILGFTFVGTDVFPFGHSPIIINGNILEAIVAF